MPVVQPTQCHIRIGQLLCAVLVGTVGLCVVCSPANLESPADLSAKSYWRCYCREVPSSSISHLGSAPQRAGPWPFYKLHTTSVLISLLTGSTGPQGLSQAFPVPHLCCRLHLGPLPAPLSRCRPALAVLPMPFT